MQATPVTFATVRRQYDFKSIEIGHWVQPEERDRAAVRFHQALADLRAGMGKADC